MGQDRILSAASQSLCGLCSTCEIVGRGSFVVGCGRVALYSHTHTKGPRPHVRRWNESLPQPCASRIWRGYIASPRFSLVATAEHSSGTTTSCCCEDKMHLSWAQNKVAFSLSIKNNQIPGSLLLQSFPIQTFGLEAFTRRLSTSQVLIRLLIPYGRVLVHCSNCNKVTSF